MTQLRKGETRKCRACTFPTALARTHGATAGDFWPDFKHDEYVRYGCGDDVVLIGLSGSLESFNGHVGEVCAAPIRGRIFVRLAKNMATEFKEENLRFQRRKDYEDRVKLTRLVTMYEEKASQLQDVCIDDAFSPIFNTKLHEALFPLVPESWLSNRYEAVQSLSRKSAVTRGILEKFQESCTNWIRVGQWMDGWNALTLECREAMLCAAWDVTMRVLPKTYGDDGPAWCKQIVPEYGSLAKSMDVPAVIRMLQATYNDLVEEQTAKIVKINRAWRAQGVSALPDTTPTVGHTARWAKCNVRNCANMFANLRIQYATLICQSLLEGILRPSGLKLFQDAQKANETDTCAICVEKFVPGELTRELDCGHVFHRECIEAWIPQSLACPLCRSGPKHAAAQNPGGHTALAQEEMTKRMGVLRISLSLTRRLKAMW